ncbi:cytochrome P450 monooxygenase [Phyllosticta capitalensis]|uniref:Cytochrome P450 monooxygenase n=1 Tax=Phyllosticta capitalensis TaxID=121624 RepID=A0ABR1Z3E8_9PEZI
MAPLSSAVSTYTESPSRLAGVLILGTVFLWIAQKLYHALTSPLRKIPGPFWSHVTHYPLKWAVITGRRTHFIHDLHLRYGSIVRISPWEVACCDAEAARTIHRPGSGFVKTKWYKTFADADHEGIFDMSDTKKHASRRRLMARAFSKSEIRGRWEGMVQEKVRLALWRIDKEVSDEGQADLLKWWTFMATDVSGTFMFGESFNMLEYGKKNDYIHVLENVIVGGGIRAELPLLCRIGQHLPITACQNMFNSTYKITQYGTKAVLNSRRKQPDDSSTTGPGTTIFAQLDPDELAHTAYPLTDADINREAGNFIVAGSDTTAVTLTYLTWAILRRPSLHRSLVREVSSLSEPFSDAVIEASCPFLNASITEALRLYGAAPGSLPRTHPTSPTTLAGFTVPAGVTVSTQAWSLHRDASAYPNPESFEPERWLEQQPGSTSPAPSFPTSATHFQPFGVGPRTCLGLHLAMMELRVAMARFLAAFGERAGLAKDMSDEEMEVVNFFLIRPKGERCSVVLSEAEGGMKELR